MSRRCVLADDEASEGVHIDGSHHPERIPMSDEVADLGKRAQVANFSGGAETEGHPLLLSLAHPKAGMPNVCSAKRLDGVQRRLQSAR